MLAQVKLVATIVCLTAAVIYAPTAWRTASALYQTLVKAEQVFIWLSAPIATVDGKSTNRALLLDCAVKTQLLDAHAADINAAFAKDTGGCK